MWKKKRGREEKKGGPFKKGERGKKRWPVERDIKHS
jgi:hypothetical protein